MRGVAGLFSKVINDAVPLDTLSELAPTLTPPRMLVIFPSVALVFQKLLPDATVVHIAPFAPATGICPDDAPAVFRFGIGACASKH